MWVQKVDGLEWMTAMFNSAIPEFNHAVTPAAPAWQAGKWNAVGGHIELGETAKQAMEREFYEEAGVRTSLWQPFATLSGEDFVVQFFSVFSSTLQSGVHTTTDEPVSVFPITTLPNLRTIPNVLWLVQMALSMDFDKARLFKVQEVYV